MLSNFVSIQGVMCLHFLDIDCEFLSFDQEGFELNRANFELPIALRANLNFWRLWATRGQIVIDSSGCNHLELKTLVFNCKCYWIWGYLVRDFLPYWLFCLNVHSRQVQDTLNSCFCFTKYKKWTAAPGVVLTSIPSSPVLS